MRAVLMTAPDHVAVENVADPTPDSEEVVIAVAGCGICGTDIHLLDGELPYQPFPVVPGHEFVGEVVAAGLSVDPSIVGAQVAVDPNLACGACAECRRGRSNLCENYAALGVTTDGGCAEYVRAPIHAVYRLPEGMSSEAAQLAEPLSCAVHGFDLLPRRPADRYLIYGAGTMGLLMGLLAQDQSTDHVTMVEPNVGRAAQASALGFSVVTCADQLDPGARWETVVDCTGVVAAIEDGLSRVRRGGVLQCFGVTPAHAKMTISPFDIYRNEISIIGSMAVLVSFDRAVRLAAHHAERLAAMVSHRFGLDDYTEAIGIFRRGEGTKIVVGGRS